MAEPWAVDPLTRKVFFHSVTAALDPDETQRLRHARAERLHAPDVGGPLSEQARAVLPLLTASELVEVDDVLQRLPRPLQRRLDALSPIAYLSDVRAPLIVLLHDRDDLVIPAGESRNLCDALSDHPGVRYTEFTAFRHLAPTTGNPSRLALAKELARFARAIYPVFRAAFDPLRT